LSAQEPNEAGGKATNPPRELTLDLGKGVKLEMVFIPAGEFLMGSPDSDTDARDCEKPQHRVRITRPFYLGKYQVTQEQWEALMGNNPSHFRGSKNSVENVSWEDCQHFLAKLNAKIGTQGGKFVLPTEAQWEYACRAGSKTKYHFGDNEDRLGDYAWYDGNSTSFPPTHPGGETHPVGEKKPNASGLYDTCGNVGEWCQDWYHGRYYAKSPTDNPTGPRTRTERSSAIVLSKDSPTDRTEAPYTVFPMGTDRVTRGSSGFDNYTHSRSAARHYAIGAFNFVGLRVARVLVDK
jgi:formylglycine-generating enzyme required for sulfatase activity